MDDDGPANSEILILISNLLLLIEEICTPN